MEQRLYMGDLAGLSEIEAVDFIASEFCVERETVSKFELLIAEINNEQYEADAYFLIRDRETNALFEVSGSHCSCMGFEGQWEPTPTTISYLTSNHYAYGNSHPDIKLMLTKFFNTVLTNSILNLN